VKIGILNLEPKYRNYALDKLRVYHLATGHEVEDYFPLAHASYDKVYCSSIFSWTPKPNIPGAVCGGSGFNLTTKLPIRVETIKIRQNYGFTTRGCIRHCPFCIVPQKEGGIRKVNELLDLWDGKAKDITLYDNNILALPDHFHDVFKQAIEHNLRLDFNQGLDYRLLTPDIAGLLAVMSHKEYHFAFDVPASKTSVGQAIEMLQQHGIRRSIWYVLVGFNTSFQEDIERLDFLRERGQDVYVQRYNMKTTKRLTALARWANQHGIFRAMSFKQFLGHPDNARYPYFKAILEEK
jgi:hypothetical protein